MKQSNPRPQRGFTLTELLVVIGIVVVIAALSMMGLNRMRAAGDRAATISIMRQLHVANTGYANDHGGQYVPLVSKDKGGAISMEWYRDPAFLAYLTGDPDLAVKSGEVTVPTSVLDPVVVRARKRHWDRLSASYGFNSTGLSYPTDDGSTPFCYRIHQIADPARTAFIVTATDYTVNYAGRYLWRDMPIEGKTTNSKMAYRHGGKAVVAYYDGTTGFIGMDDMRRIDANGGRDNPFWKAKQP